MNDPFRSLAKLAGIQTGEPECQGMFFRCRVNQHWDREKGWLTERVEYRLLRRVSCSGCKCCGGFWEDLGQAGMDVMRLPKDPRDGAMYKAVLDPGPRDWETGILDDWSWELKLVAPEKGAKG